MEQMKLPSIFKVPGPKTLKVDIKEGAIISTSVDNIDALGYAVTQARNYLNSQDQYLRIEFKWDRNYIVVAKLKGEKDANS
jgi:phage-related protein